MNNKETRICQNCKKTFVIEPEDFTFYEKMKVPPPTWCPECRMKRRTVWRNEINLYKRPDSKTGEIIFSALSKEAPVLVYEREYWWSDKWDPCLYEQEYNWNKPFFQQFYELLMKVPWPSRTLKNQTRSDYSNNANDLKDCYLVFSSAMAENSLYADNLTKSFYAVDSSFVINSEYTYEGYWNSNCSNALFSSRCESSYNIIFCRDCINVNNCFGCIGLRNKSYYIFNQPYSKDEYFQKLKEFNVGSYSALSDLKNRVNRFFIKYPVKFMSGTHNVDVSGDYIFHSKRVKSSFYINQGEDIKYSNNLRILTSKDSYDHYLFGRNSELIYEGMVCGENSSRLKFCFNCWPNCNDISYSLLCSSSSNLFGCISLRHKQYCILNKQYSKEEYEKLVPKIIEHMNDIPYVDKKGRIYKYGEFFPPELSPFAYNETIAQEYFPLTKEQAIEQGYRWKEPEERNVKPDIKTEDLPDHIKDVKDDIIGKTIQCSHTKIKKDGTLEATCNEQCTTAFKIVPQELQFYKRMNLPLPRLCPNCRHYQRLKQRNPLKLWKRKCMCGGSTSTNGVYKNTVSHFHGKESCPNEFETTYSPDRPEIVYCEECYLREVV